MKLNIRKLQIAMARKQLSSKKLAEETGFTHNTICNYVAGRFSPSPDRIGKLAKALEVDPETLID